MFGNFELVGTLEGKLNAMSKRQREFMDATNNWRATVENFMNAEIDFVPTAIHQMNAAESHVGAICVDAQPRKSVATLREAFASGAPISKVAKLSVDGHLIYNSRSAEVSV